MAATTTSSVEVWKDIPGFEGAYQVNRNGEILSLRSGQLRKPTRSGHGYVKVSLSSSDHKKVQINVHRIVAEAFCEKPNAEATEVNHINCDKTDNRADNLEWVTPEYNKAHAYKSGKTDYRRPKRKDNSSGFPGVSKHGSKWQATITYKGKQDYLGLFKTLDEAVKARKAAEAQYENVIIRGY